MKILRFLAIFLGAATVMLLSLLWVSQFFGGDGDVTPVIWIEELQQETGAGGRDEDSFAEWETD